MTYSEMVNAVMAAMKVGDRDAALAVVEAWQAANPGVPLSIPVVFVDEDGEPVEQVVFTPKPEEEEPEEEPITAVGIADELYGLASEIGEGVKYHGEFDMRSLVEMVRAQADRLEGLIADYLEEQENAEDEDEPGPTPAVPGAREDGVWLNMDGTPAFDNIIEQDDYMEPYHVAWEEYRQEHGEDENWKRQHGG